MKTLFTFLFALAALLAGAQSITSAPTYTGTLAAGDNAYLPVVLNGTLRKVQATTINRLRIDSLVTALSGYATTASVSAKVTANGAITGATKAKITYDSKGLVTAGADLVAADIPALAISGITGLQAALDGKQAAGSYVTDASLATTLAGYQAAGDYALNDDVSTLLGGKVDVVAGKGLSTNDFTDAYESKLDNIANGATANYDNATLLAFANHTGYITTAQIDPAYVAELDVYSIDDKSIACLKAEGSAIYNQTLGVDVLTTNTATAANSWDGTVRCTPIYFNRGDTVKFLSLEVTTAASVDLTMDNNTKLGLYKWNSDGTVSLVCSTSTIADTNFETIGIKTFAITATAGGASQYIVSGPGLYFGAFMYNQASATTPPQIRSGTRGGQNISGGLSTKFHFNVSGTDLPSSITTSTATTSGYAIWVGVSK